MAQKHYDLNSSPVHLLRRCNQYCTDLFDAETAGSDLTARQLTVLIAVEAHDGLEKVGSGTHVRWVVEEARFGAKTREKAAMAAETLPGTLPPPARP